jgi:hypothetical protein
LRVEYKRSAGDDRATAAAHGIVDLQPFVASSVD